MAPPRRAALAAALALACLATWAEAGSPRLSKERLVFQTDFGDLHMAFYPDVAPRTVEHMRKLGEMGLFNTNHFFRVDRGFVAQTADVLGGRSAPMNPEQKAEAEKHVPLEVVEGVKHDKRGILSMARGSDPNSGGSSFSVLLGPAPHLDMEYSIFGEVTHGIETLAKMEEVETRREGIFVMPTERITILSTYTYVVEEGKGAAGSADQLCSEALAEVSARYEAVAEQVERIRQQSLPGN